MFFAASTLALVGLFSCIPQDSFAQIRSAEERMRRQSLNAREHITLKQVKANKFDLKGQVFLLRLFVNNNHDMEQIDANRYQIWIENSPGEGGIQLAHIPRSGIEAFGTSIQQGDVVIARMKEDEANLTLEIIGVSALNVWR